MSAKTLAERPGSSLNWFRIACVQRREIERLRAALQTIAGAREDTQYQRAPSLAHAQRIARAALEESK